MKPTGRYILPAYAQKAHLTNNRTEREDEWKITYSQNSIKIELAETNSLIEDKYGLNLSSAHYLLEGTASKEMMIHHHTKGHPHRHLQFQIKALRKTIRIPIDKLDNTDYDRCIKGFLHICQEVIAHEGQLYEIETNLQQYFFNENIQQLAPEREFLLQQIKNAYNAGQITSDENPLNEQNLLDFKKEQALKPFLDW